MQGMAPGAQPGRQRRICRARRTGAITRAF